VVIPPSEIDASNADELADSIQADGSDLVVVDCSAITFIDSSGLSVFAAARQELNAAGRGIRLENPSAPLKRLLEITDMGDLLT
jgi:anti-sigma B factor antagonist